MSIYFVLVALTVAVAPTQTSGAGFGTLDHIELIFHPTPEDAGDSVDEYRMELGDFNGSPGTIRYSTPTIGQFDVLDTSGVGARVSDEEGAVVALGYAAGGVQYPDLIGVSDRGAADAVTGYSPDAPWCAPFCPPRCPMCPPAPCPVCVEPTDCGWEPTDEPGWATRIGMPIGPMVGDDDGYADMPLGYSLLGYGHRAEEFTLEVGYGDFAANVGYGHDIGGVGTAYAFSTMRDGGAGGDKKPSPPPEPRLPPTPLPIPAPFPRF